METANKRLEIKRNPIFWEKNPEKKDLTWANGMVSIGRREWRHIIDVEATDANMNYLLSQQDLKQIKNGFSKSSDFVANTDWIAIAVMDRISNILVAEFLKAAYKPFVEAVDVASQLEKKAEKTKLAGRPILERTMNELNGRTGDPPYQMPYDEFNSNIEDFDKMGLDDTRPQDIQFFMDNFSRLWHEADAQELCVALLKENEFDIHVQKMVHDILARMCVSFQVYASPTSGKIVWKYIDPKSVKAIQGDRPDGKDDLLKGWEQMITIRQFMDFAGPKFNFDRDWIYLRDALNFHYGYNITLINHNGCFTTETSDEKTGTSYRMVLSHNEMLGQRIGCGYMEWKSVDSIVRKVNRRSGLFVDVEGRLRKYNEKTGKWEDGPYKRDVFEEDEKFSKDVKEFQKTYKTWYIATGYDQQFLFHFGPLFHQISEGAYDEYSNFSIQTYKMIGKSAVEIARPFIDIVNEAFYKILWAIKESTPRKRVYNYDAIINLIMKLKPKQPQGPSMGLGPQQAPQLNIQNQIDQVIGMFRNSLTEMYTNVPGEGQPNTPQRPHYWDEGGLDPLAAAMQTVMDWAEAQVSSRLGINPIRDAYAPDPKDGFKINQLAIQQSRNATYYVPYMMGSIVKNSAYFSLCIAQDAIEFKSTPVYSYLETLISTDSMWTFRSLDNIPFHRYGIFVEMFSVEEKKQKISQDAENAYARKEINYGQKLIVQEMDDPKRAGMMIEHFRRKNMEDAERAADAAAQRAMAINNNRVQGEIALVDRKGYWDLQREDRRGNYYMRAHQTPAEAAIQKKQMDQENNAQKLDEKANATIKVKRAEKEMEASATPPLAPVSATVPLPDASAGQTATGGE